MIIGTGWLIAYIKNKLEVTYSSTSPFATLRVLLLSEEEK